jgi:hypothetical protein
VDPAKITNHLEIAMPARCTLISKTGALSLFPFAHCLQVRSNALKPENDFVQIGRQLSERTLPGIGGG